MTKILVDTREKARKLLEVVQREPVLGFDTESSGPRLLKKDMINVHRSELTGYSVYSPASGTSWYVPMRHALGNIDYPTGRGVLEALANRSGRTWVHNLKHEYHVARIEEVAFSYRSDRGKPGLPWYCSQLARWWLDKPSSAKKGPYKLKNFARDMGYEVRDFNEVAKGRTWRDVPPAEALEYACLDAEVACRLGEEAFPSLGAGYFDVEVPFAEVLADMEARGMRVDTDELSAIHREAEEAIARVEEEWLFTWPSVDIGSAQQVRKHFFGQGLWSPEGCELTPKRKEPKVDDHAMALQLANKRVGAEGRRAAELRIEWSDWDKVRSTYSESMVLFASQHVDNRLRPNFRGDGTKTGRLSCEQPNLQNIPARTALGKRLKACFGADFGKVVLCADYSQIELRILAHFAKRGRLYDGYREGRDVHAETAELLSVSRDGGKKYNFSRIYGAGPKKLARDQKLDEQTVKKHVALHEKLYPEVVAVRDGFISYVKEHGYIRCIGGKYRYLPGIHSDTWKERGHAERCAMNCFDYETEVLTKHGWRVGTELTDGVDLLAFDPADKSLGWSPATIFHHQYAGPLHTWEGRSFSAATTPNHRWFVCMKGGRERVRTSEEFRGHGDERIPRVGTYVPQEACVLTDDEIRVAAWAATDATHRNGRITIMQSKPGTTRMLTALLDRFGVAGRLSKNGQTWWTLPAELSKKILPHVSGRRFSWDFLWSLRPAQARLLLEHVQLADGQRICASDRDKAERYQVLATLAGLHATVAERDTTGETRHSPKVQASGITATKPHYIVRICARKTAQVVRKQMSTKLADGVWCPSVATGFVLVRRRGHVYVTGQTPIQGSAGYIVKLGMLAAYRAGVPQVCQVHDEVVAEVSECYAEDVQRTLDKALEGAYPLRVPLVVESKTGRNWAEAK